MADTPSRGGRAGTYVSPYVVNVTYGSAGGTPGPFTQTGWFDPLPPMRPIAPPDVAGRRFDFPAGYNLVTRPRAYEPIGFAELRGFADACDVLRLVIETRKDQMARQRWTIKPRDPMQARMTASKRPAEMQGRIDAAVAFLRKPDRYSSWKTWIHVLLEDMFVIDAATLYCQRTRGGKLYALHYIAGDDIKRVIDDWGRTPTPYPGADGRMVYPSAYQHVLKGLPAVDYSTRDIIYRPRNVRANKVYGFSPVQQVLLTVQIVLRRQLWLLDYFTEGSVPDALIGVPSNWDTNHIKQFQEYWDTEFSGDLAKRRKAKFVPGDVAGKIHQTKEPDHKQPVDELLIRIICYAFSVSPNWAVSLMNRATAQQHSTDADEQGLEPTKEWVKDLIDGILADESDSPDLELAWLAEADTDPTKQNAILDSETRGARRTINEARDAAGLERYTNPAADVPMVFTQALGYIPIDANLGIKPGDRAPGASGSLSGAPDENAGEVHEPSPREPEAATEEVVG